MGTPDVMSQAPQLVLIKFLAALANYTPNCFYTYYYAYTQRRYDRRGVAQVISLDYSPAKTYDVGRGVGG